MKQARVWIISSAIIAICLFGAAFVISAIFTAKNNELGKAIEVGDVVRVKSMLAQGARANCRYMHRATPLHVAALNGQGEIAEILIAHGGNVNAINAYGNSPLMEVRERPGKLNPTQVLLGHGADLHVVNNVDGYTALWLAVLNKQSSSVKLLLLHGADPNYLYKDFYLLMCAVAINDVMLTKLLIAHGANVNAKRSNGDTALKIARRLRHSSIEKILLKAGAKE